MLAESVSADGLSLYFTSNRAGGSGSWDLWMTTRETTSDPWGGAVNLGPTVNSWADEICPSISADGLELYFSDYRVTRPGGYYDLWVTKRPTRDDPWGTPVNLGDTVNSSTLEMSPFISADSLTLLFHSWRPGGVGGKDDIWMTRRATDSDPWCTPVNLGPPINSTFDDYFPSLSANGSTLYFGSNQPGGSGGPDLWQASVIPIVDFNGDGVVDAADMCIMVDHWGDNYSLCDIGPMPWGDGVVDVKDLIVLSEHLLPVFAAHWELDETAGNIAYDSVGDYDGLLNGDPLWQSVGGKVNGTLQFDGIDDYVSAPSILDAARRSLSAFAWIKGGEPGQVILSQTDGVGYGAAWLGADSSGGGLTTKLMDPLPALKSEAVITDGAWHHIGLVWDGSFRCLYVDGAEVAKDAAALSQSIPCDGGLHLGAGKTLDAGSFFSGLIDDVRIYSRALNAEEIVTLAE